MSSTAETLLPMRGLAAYAEATGDDAARAAADRAADFLLDRRLAWRRSTGEPLDERTVQLRYPLYWHYDVLGALRGMAELGRIDDPRCADGLDLLESKRLPGGGWPAEGRYWKPAAGSGPHRDRVDWGPTGRGRRNDWVTAHALAVLVAAGRRPGGVSDRPTPAPAPAARPGRRPSPTAVARPAPRPA